MNFKSLIAVAIFSFCAEITIQPTIAAPSKYDLLMKEANHQLETMEPEKALKIYNEAIKLRPKEYIGYKMRSECYRELNNSEKEIEDATHAIECFNAGPLYRDRGEAYARHARYKEAIADYTKALTIDKDDQNTIRARARAYLALKDNKNAISDFEYALRTMNKGSLRMEPDLMTVLGGLYVKTKQDQKALDLYNLLIRRYPTMGRGYYGRAEVYKLQGKNDLAKKDLQKAHELDYAMDPSLSK